MSNEMNFSERFLRLYKGRAMVDIDLLRLYTHTHTHILYDIHI